MINLHLNLEKDRIFLWYNFVKLVPLIKYINLNLTCSSFVNTESTVRDLVQIMHGLPVLKSNLCPGHALAITIIFLY